MFKKENWFVKKTVNRYGEERTEEVFRGGKLVAFIIGGIFSLIIIFGSFSIVGPQQSGIVVRTGSINRSIDSGMALKFPILESVVKIDMSTIALPVTELAYSKDGQIISMEATIQYAVEPSSVTPIYREFKKDYEARLILPRVKEAIKTVTSNYTAQGIIDNRAKISSEIQIAVLGGLEGRGFQISGVALTNIDFDDAYEAAIKNKQVQEQQALAQVNITKQEDEKKKQEILKAEALSEKTRLEAVALQSAQGEKLIEKIYAEAALEAAKKWNGVLPTQMIPGGTLPFINLTK